MEDEIKFLSLPDVIKYTIVYLDKKDYESLHMIENRALEQAITDYNKDFSEVCVMIYGLRKLISKKHIFETEEWTAYQKRIIENLNLSLTNYRDEDLSKFNNFIKDTMAIIKDADRKLGRYVSVVIEDGRIKLASTAYAYGLSAAQASDLLSISKKQLMAYVGITKMPDEDKQFKSIGERVHLLDVMSGVNAGDNK